MPYDAGHRPLEAPSRSRRSLPHMIRFAPLMVAITACGPPVSTSAEIRTFEVELDQVIAQVRGRRRGPWRTVALDDARLAHLDVELPRQGCHLLVVLTDGEGELLDLRREPTSSLGAPGLAWLPVCDDEPGPRSLATTVTARAPMSRGLHLAIYEVATREAAQVLSRSYLPEPSPNLTAPAIPAPTAPSIDSPAPPAPPAPSEPAPPSPEGDAPRCTPDPRARALALYAEGRAAADGGRLDEAAEAFDQAYACVPDGTILFSAAGVHARRGDVESAVERYERLLARHGERLSRVMRRQVDDALEALRRPVQVRVQVPSRTTVTLGGVVLESGGGRVVPGTYRLVWRRGETRHVEEIQVRPGERLQVPAPEVFR